MLIKLYNKSQALMDRSYILFYIILGLATILSDVNVVKVDKVSGSEVQLLKQAYRLVGDGSYEYINYHTMLRFCHDISV